MKVDLDALKAWHRTQAENMSGIKIARATALAEFHTQAITRIEALEAENARLREVLVEHNCGTPGCLCYECCRAKDAALATDQGEK